MIIWNKQINRYDEYDNKVILFTFITLNINDCFFLPLPVFSFPSPPYVIGYLLQK